MRIYVFCLLVFLSTISANCKPTQNILNQQKVESILAEELGKKDSAVVIMGAERLDVYLPLIMNKNVGVVTNQTGVVRVNEEGKVSPQGGSYQHLVDVLLAANVNVRKIFAPEHGFRGEADAGEKIKDGKDVKTNLPIISLYGENRKPSSSQIKDLDVILFDIQDVGVRFYTYISTLHMVMEAAAESSIPVIILDRPNPNARYIDGPVLDPAFKSFVGMHPVPVVYGMTMGEYGKMINGESWLAAGVKTKLTVVPLQNYTHDTPYSLPVRPSPNLPNDQSINLYPSLCFFEGTNVSVGRGTDMQFQVYGSPYMGDTNFSFTPHPNFGAKNPDYNGVKVYGEDLRLYATLHRLELKWLLKAYENNTKAPFFNPNLFFDKLAGTNQLRKQIENHIPENEIRASWQKEIESFKKIRVKYLLYP